MNKRWSLKYLLLNLLLFLFGGVLLYGTMNILAYLNSYSAKESEYIDSYSFNRSYMKYIERLTLYTHYTDLGYTVDMSSANDLEDIINMDESQFNRPSELSDEQEQSDFEFYNYCLNIQSTNFLYYVKNTQTGAVYYSPALKELYPDDITQFTDTIKDNPVYFIFNTKTGKYATNAEQEKFGILSKSDLSWISTTLSSEFYSDTSGRNERYNYIIYTGIVPDFTYNQDIFYREYHQFTTLRENFRTSLYIVPIAGLLSLLTLLWMIIYVGNVKCGITNNTNVNGIFLSWFDRVPLEISIILIIGILAGEIVLVSFSDYLFPLDNISSMIQILLCYLLFYPLTAISFFSLVRRIKSKTLFTNTLLYRIRSSFHNRVKEYLSHHDITYRVSLFILCFLGLQGFGFFLTMMFRRKFFMITFLLLSYYYLIHVLAKAAVDLGVILEGTKKLQSGEMNLKIPVETLSPPINELGDYINNINSGLMVAVEERTKSERFKAELITNVSHDIKTPLTSIINYVDLLKKVPPDSPKSAEYLEVLSSKSWRLKTLIEDLVEASKASSGAIKMNPLKINLVELLKQASGEFDDRFHENNLEVVITAPNESISIFADGRSTFRVIDNLFSNVNKYAMQNTRVYVDMWECDGFGWLSIKNISKSKLNITPQELMERFVRGDVSRNTEGSGLGLSISKSLTLLQHGTFDIEVDGDLFKVILSFPLYLNPIQ